MEAERLEVEAGREAGVIAEMARQRIVDDDLAQAEALREEEDPGWRVREEAAERSRRAFLRKGRRR